jgi:hypothetical protein
MPLINYIGNRQECLDNKRGRGNAPTAPSLSFDYLIVGGGGKVNLSGFGGGAGGFLASSASIDFNTTIDIVVGAGASGSQESGSISSIISPKFGTVISYGGNAGQSGQPTGNPAGLGGPPPIGTGGGAGAGQAGINGVDGQSGRGGSGSMWLDGNFYAGGGGGAGNATLPSGNGDGTIDNGLGGGGRGAVGGCTTCQPGQNGEDGKGGGAGGGMEKGGSGIVILRYLTSNLVPPYDRALSGGTLSVTGSYAYLTFTGSAQLRYSF